MKGKSTKFSGKWTNAQKKKAREELTSLSKGCEYKPLTNSYVQKHLHYYKDGHAQLIGRAHDYSYWLPEVD
jgi:hypothetical protein